MKTKYLKMRDGLRVNISRFPNFSGAGSITGMKRRYYGRDALLVRCGQFIYDVTAEPYIYYDIAK